MFPDVQWITALYAFGPDCDHIAVPDGGRAKLLEMGNELQAESGLVAIYIPVGTPNEYEPQGTNGCIVGAVRLLPLAGRRIEQFFYDHWDESRRWPIGWPCEVVYALTPDEMAPFREDVESLRPGSSFRGYVAQFLYGPFKLEPLMRNRLNHMFEQLDPINPLREA